MSRILVATSGVWAAQRMVEPLCDLARRLGAEVFVVHVSRPASGQLRENEQADGEQAVSLLRQELEKRQITVQTMLLFSDEIASAVAATAEEREATLIVLGLTGKNVFARLVTGNVPMELLKSTKIPVLLVPTEWTVSI
jgi:nucleotide-binding universal stress UspA family protein